MAALTPTTSKDDLLSEWVDKRLIWIPDESEGFVKARIVKEGSGTYVVEMCGNGQQKQTELSKDDCPKINPPTFDKVIDLADLPYLNAASVLDTLKRCYNSHLNYADFGLSCCIVLNPFHAAKGAVSSNDKDCPNFPPHVDGVVKCAYAYMLQGNWIKHQSIIFTGNSGAGKTENAQKAVQCIVQLAKRRANTAAAKASTSSFQSASSSAKNKRRGLPRGQSDRDAVGDDELAQRLLLVDEILGAFGNSKTTLNDNSSRFSKFIRINFDKFGCISDANIEFYLLENSRTCRQAADERSFHIFYQFLRGASKEEKDNFLLLEDVSNYRFLNNISLPNVDDAAEFHKTMHSMKLMGLHDQEIKSLLSVVSAVLMLGNIEFKQKKGKAKLPEGTETSVPQRICQLLGLSVTDFMEAILRPKIRVGNEHVQKPQSKEQAEFAVETISKVFYERMFRWLVNRLNQSLRTRRIGTSFIGLLDIAGFETLKVNSFEQLCINYTNEKLQQLSNGSKFVSEKILCGKVGIDWKVEDFRLELQPTIELIENPTTGILSLLDKEGIDPNGTDKSLVEKLFSHHQKHPKFMVPETGSRSDFAVMHYSGRVDYSTDQWLLKNVEPLNEDVVQLMQNSSDPLVASIWMEYTHSAAGATVAHKHRMQLAQLMETLSETFPHFVRCIIPNRERRPDSIDSVLVLDQLRTTGVLEDVRIHRQCFRRLSFARFRERYEAHVPKLNDEANDKEATRQIVKHQGLDETGCVFGQTGVHLRKDVFDFLNDRCYTKQSTRTASLPPNKVNDKSAQLIPRSLSCEDCKKKDEKINELGDQKEKLLSDFLTKMAKFEKELASQKEEADAKITIIEAELASQKKEAADMKKEAAKKDRKMREELAKKDAKITIIEAELASQKKEADAKITIIEAELASQKKEAADMKKEIESLQMAVTPIQLRFLLEEMVPSKHGNKENVAPDPDWKLIREVFGYGEDKEKLRQQINDAKGILSWSIHHVKVENGQIIFNEDLRKKLTKENLVELVKTVCEHYDIENNLC